jgi:hypothetical protein
MRTLPLLLAATLLTGCNGMLYRGTSPNVRSFSEDPTVNQYYIGFDLEFALTDPDVDPDHPTARQASLPQEPEDTAIVPKPLPEPNIPF